MPRKMKRKHSANVLRQGERKAEARNRRYILKAASIRPRIEDGGDQVASQGRIVGHPDRMRDIAELTIDSVRVFCANVPEPQRPASASERVSAR
jgi:hypothetical protein